MDQVSILIKMGRHIEMNFAALKSDLDNLFKGLNEPSDIVPEWTDPGVSAEALKEVEARLGVAFPEALKLASMQFSGLYHEAPYFMGDAFEKIQSQVLKKSNKELSEDDFADELEVQMVYAPTDWDNEELQSLKTLNIEYLSDIGKSKHIGIDCELAWVRDEKFMMIGTTYSESLYMDLREPASNPNYGALYNLMSLDPFCVMYKVADDYGQFLLHIKHSLEKKIQLDAEDGDDN